MAAPKKIDLDIVKGDTFSYTFTRLGEQYLNFRGEWSKLADYEEDDVVVWKNNIYKNILDTTANQKPSDITYWGSVAPFDYSGSTFEAKIRTNYDEEASIVDFVVEFITDGTDGKFRITLTAAQTAALDFDEAVWDVEITDGVYVWKEGRGIVHLYNEATR